MIAFNQLKRWTFWTAAGVLIVFTASYLSFVAEIRDPKKVRLPTFADAIVVLTGDSNRIYPAVGLLQSASADRLLISGVNQETTGNTLRKKLAVSRWLFECCVDLDYFAFDTKGNAINTAYWAKYHNFSRIIVVTSDYHMPRTLLLMSKTMPSVKLVPRTVASNFVNGQSWSQVAFSPAVFREFSKYTVARLGFEPAAKIFQLAWSGEEPFEG